MNVVILKNISTEGPGTIEDYLKQAGISHSIIDLSIGEALPELDSFTHVLVMGGPMAVYEIHRYPYIINEALFLDRAIRADKHVLGVCLGAQLLAHVLGARVYPGGRKEIGWYEVALTSEGMQDPVMSVLALPGKPAAQVFQWHGDTFELPKGAVRLASSGLYENQAFRYQDRVYALQFHIEVTPVIVRGWLVQEQGIDLASITAESDRIYHDYSVRAKRFYERFFKT
jgi:GMP synthase-like glutamine amidotransferase